MPLSALAHLATLAATIALVWTVVSERLDGRVPLVSLGHRWLGRGKTTVATMAVAAAAGVLLVVVPVAIAVVLAGAAAPPGGLTLTEIRYRAPREGWLLLTLATVAAKLALVVFEEVAFRGALLDRLKARIGGRLAVVATALVFGAAHAARPGDTSHALAVALTFVDGIGYGAAAFATSSLWTPIAWHFAKNLAVWQLTGTSTLELAPGLFAFTEGSTPLADLAAAVIVVGVAVPLLSAARREGPPAQNGSAPDAPGDADSPD